MITAASDLLMLAALESRFGDTDLAPAEVEWITGNGSAYIV